MSSPATGGFARFLNGACNLLTTIVNGVLVSVESTVGWLLSLIAAIVSFLFVVPVIGALLRWIWNFALAVVWRLVGLLNFLVGLTGLWPEKILRVKVVILRDKNGNALTTPAAVVSDLQKAIDIFEQEANVKIVPSRAFCYNSGFAGPRSATADWISQNSQRSPDTDLRVACGAGALVDDLLLTGSRFTITNILQDFFGNFRRLIGYGAPLLVVVTRNVGAHYTIGCSLGPVTNYVTVEAGNTICIAHELGHACGLWHINEANNLLNPTTGPGNIKLHNWQVSLLRNSRHVTFF